MYTTYDYVQHRLAWFVSTAYFILIGVVDNLSAVLIDLDTSQVLS